MDDADPKCLLCGKSVSLSYFQTCLKQKTKDHLYSKWAQNYSKSLCDLLDLDSSFQVLFQDADYCTSCLQIVHEIDFSLRTLKSLEIKVTKFRTTVQTLLYSNMANIRNSGIPEEVNSETSPTRNTVTYDKVIQCICDQLPPPRNTDPVDSLTVQDDRVAMAKSQPAPASVKARRSSRVKVSNICRVLLGRKGLSKSERIKLIKIQQVTKNTNHKSPKRNLITNGPLNVTKTNVRMYSSKTRAGANQNRKNFGQVAKPELTSKTTKLCEMPRPAETPKLHETPNSIETSRSQATSPNLPKTHTIINPPSTKDELPKPPSKQDEFQKIATTRTRIICSYENCSYSCFNDLELSAHVFGQHQGDSNPYHCPVCPLKYTNSSNLKYHIRQHHAEKSNDAQAFLSCNYCGKKFTAQEESGLLKRHEALHGRSPIFSCVIPKCKTRQFSSSVDLKNHVALKHEETVPVSKCLECNLVCANPKSLRKHIKNIHCERNPALKCKECSYIGRVPSDIVLHMTKHSDERNFHCQECKASYKNKCSLGFHMKNVHLKPGDKKHKCGQCPMAFSQASILKKHEQSHATCRLYACKKCDTRFKHIATLQAHEKHTCKGNSSSGKKTIIKTRNNRKSPPIKTRITKAENIDEQIQKSMSELSDDSEPTMYSSEISISTEETHSDSTGDSDIAMMEFSDPLDNEIKDEMGSGSNDLDTLICSGDNGENYNWINPDLFGEEFATLDIFEEAEASSLISAVLPLHGSNIEVIWE